jgi:hypothetical protein
MNRRMMTLISSSLFTILIGSGTLATRLQAQSDSAVRVNIPIAFTVGKQTMAPGTYKLSLTPDPFVLSVVNAKTGDQEMFEVRPEQGRSVEQRGRVVFHRLDGLGVLDEVHFPGADTFSQVIQPHFTKMEAKGSSPSNSVAVAQR